MITQCEIFCVGNAVADTLARPVETLGDPGASQPLDVLTLGLGGNSVNTAVALARLGSKVRIAAAVGNDRLGRMIREVLREKGVDDSNLVTVEGFNTSASVVLIQVNGERRLLHYRGASAAFAESHIDWRLAEGARIFHCASAFALPAFDGAPFERAIVRAKRLGCLTSINICWDTKNRWLPLLHPALEHTDFIFPNVDEGYKLTGEREPDAIARCLRLHGVKTVVVKLGAAGCYVQGPAGSFTSPGFKVNPVDTTGAGDCFAAAFLAEISRGAALEEAARFANAAGALSTLGMGGADSAPTRQQVVEFMGKC